MKPEDEEFEPAVDLTLNIGFALNVYLSISHFSELNSRCLLREEH